MNLSRTLKFTAIKFATMAILLGVPFFSANSFAEVGAKYSTCNVATQGGVDGFPWWVAKPFPWSNVQGSWLVKSGPEKTYLRMKVVRTTVKGRILNLSIVNQGNCVVPLAVGVGYIDSSEKNVIRAMISDGTSRFMLKLAWFATKDLNMGSPDECGEYALAASFKLIAGNDDHQPSQKSPILSTLDGKQIENVMLVKVSPSLNAVCKKTEAR